MTTHAAAGPSLSRLGDRELNPQHQKVLTLAAASMQGPESWKTRKIAETHNLLALAECAGPSRLEVLTLDLAMDLRTVIKLHVPVALKPDAQGELRTASEAVLGLNYPQMIRAVPLPGFAVVSLLFPPLAWYPNIGSTRGQRICLGTNLPTGIPVTELVIAAYSALSLQTVNLDPADAAGVMNVSAAEWWQANQHLMPLTSEPFICPSEAVS